MAYAALIGSIPESQVAEFQSFERAWLEPSELVRTSHILATWVSIAPLNLFLREAIDGGSRLRSDLWPPLRPPTFHSAEMVRALHQNLAEAFDQATRDYGGTSQADDWYLAEISKVCSVFNHAAACGEAVVSFLDRPQDEARANKVSIPISVLP